MTDSKADQHVESIFQSVNWMNFEIKQLQTDKVELLETFRHAFFTSTTPDGHRCGKCGLDGDHEIHNVLPRRSDISTTN